MEFRGGCPAKNVPLETPHLKQNENARRISTAGIVHAINY